MEEKGQTMTIIIMEGNTLKGSMQLCVSSKAERQIILFELPWDNAKVSVALAKGDETITPI